MEPLIMNTIPAEQITSLNNHLEGWKPEAIAWLVQRKWLEPGQDLEHLSVERANSIERRAGAFRQAVFRGLFPERFAEEQRKIEQAESQKVHDRQVAKRMVTLQRMRPVEYVGMTEEQSPRPRQYRLASTFWTDPQSSPYFADDQPAMTQLNGMVLFGKSGTGKTAAAWKAIENFWLDAPFEDASFIETTRFFYLAKQRYADRDSMAEFKVMLDSALNDELIVLDDLGTEKKLSESTEEVLFQIIDTRTKNHLLTIVTTNYSMRDLEEMWLSSRNSEKIARRIKQFFLPINFDRA
jgi:DNA replication protein DnaC